MQKSLWLLVILLSTQPLALAQRSRCSLDDYEDYYGKPLEESYRVRQVADRVARALYQGPLMREGDADGVANLRMLFTHDREMTIQRIQEIVKDHLYGESPEFRELLRDLSDKQGEREASYEIVDSIYDAFDYRPGKPSEETFDACLVRNRQTHLVVTRALIKMRGVKN